ncbi:hypothetical protein [Intrasporangium mesophilum]
MSLDQWTELASLFVGHLKEDEKKLGAPPDLGPEGTPEWAQ